MSPQPQAAVGAPLSRVDGRRLDLTYRMARNHHNAMEPHATVARRDGDQLTLWDKTQWVRGTRDDLAAKFGIAKEKVRVISPFVGGAFGNSLRSWPPSPSPRWPPAR